MLLKDVMTSIQNTQAQLSADIAALNGTDENSVNSKINSAATKIKNEIQNELDILKGTGEGSINAEISKAAAKINAQISSETDELAELLKETNETATQTANNATKIANAQEKLETAQEKLENAQNTAITNIQSEFTKAKNSLAAANITQMQSIEADLKAQIQNGGAIYAEFKSEILNLQKESEKSLENSLKVAERNLQAAQSAEIAEKLNDETLQNAAKNYLNSDTALVDSILETQNFKENAKNAVTAQIDEELNTLERLHLRRKSALHLLAQCLHIELLTQSEALRVVAAQELAAERLTAGKAIQNIYHEI
jgi:uncharacterized protein YqgV (UPF0045/DUF77 family)